MYIPEDEILKLDFKNNLTVFEQKIFECFKLKTKKLKIIYLYSIGLKPKTISKIVNVKPRQATKIKCEYSWMLKNSSLG